MHHLDTLGMWEATAGLPEQLDAALVGATAAFAGAPPPAALRAVLVLAEGSLASAADAVTAYATSRASIPVTVARTATIPAFVGPGTLVIASSYSGDDPGPTVGAQRALDQGAAVVVQAGGGALGALASDYGLLRLDLAPGAPNARTAWGSALVGALVTLAHAGLIDDPGAAIAAAAAHLRRRRDGLLTPGGPAETVARNIGRTVPLVYGAGDLAAVAAQRWKSQINENVKSPAFAAALVDAAHADVVGWGQHGDVTRQVFTLIALRHGGESPDTARLFDAVLGATDEVMANVLTVVAEGEDDLTRLLDLTLFGDVVSLHMAAREGLDPGPVAAWTELAGDSR